MDRKKWVGLAGGLVIFIIILMFFIYQNSDFDQQLLESVNAGVPADKLIPQIESDSVKLKLKAKKHLSSTVMDEKFWDAPNISSENTLQFEKETYDVQIKTIDEYEEIRKKFVQGLISKEKFLEIAKNKKAVLENIMNY